MSRAKRSKTRAAYVRNLGRREGAASSHCGLSSELRANCMLDHDTGEHVECPLSHTG